MAFKLESVVPWGRNIDEYKSMFQLTETDKKRKIAGFGDGPASFNYEATLEGFDVTSFDPTRIVETNYEFQKGADRMLVIRK